MMLRKNFVDEYSSYDIEIKKIKQCTQTQESLMEQLAKLRVAANKLGLYDAADFLKEK